MDGGACQATVHGVTKSQTRLSELKNKKKRKEKKKKKRNKEKNLVEMGYVKGSVGIAQNWFVYESLVGLVFIL